MTAWFLGEGGGKGECKGNARMRGVHWGEECGRVVQGRGCGGVNGGGGCAGEGRHGGGECMGRGVGGVHGGGMQGRIQHFEREGAKVKTRGMHIFGMFNAFCCGMYCTTSIGAQSTLFLVKAVYAL